MGALKLRSLFVSDVHLGTRDARVEYLLDLLRQVECENLFLVGDVFDIWKMRGGRWHWPALNTELLQQVMDMAARGTKVIYIPGNHDEFFRDYVGSLIAGVQVEQEWEHRLADGRRALLLHGDEFDCVVRHNRLLKLIGNAGYEVLMLMNRARNHLRRRLGLSYWSLSASLKRQVANAMEYVRKFEDAALHHAHERGVEVIVCGHIHHASLREEGGITYANTGDWVEHCTALVEHGDGRLELMRWAEQSMALLDTARSSDAPKAAAGVTA